MNDVRINYNDVQATIDQLPDDRIERFLYDALERRVGAGRMSARHLDWVLKLSPGYRMLLFTNLIHNYVRHCGIGGFFWGQWEDCHWLGEEAAAGYELIGATVQARAVRAAVQAFEPHRDLCRAMRDNYHCDSREQVNTWNQWLEHWKAIAPEVDAPLRDAEMICREFRVPWIRRNGGQFMLVAPT